jgi:hypothetical protein
MLRCDSAAAVVPAEWEVEKLPAFLKGKHQEKHARLVSRSEGPRVQSDEEPHARTL